MIYGTCGSSGSGKTTLARAAAEHLDLKMVHTSITEMSRKAGFDPVKPLKLYERIELQKSLYAQFEELLKGLHGPAILDRTPLDMAMYMMAEIAMCSDRDVSAELMDWASDYVFQCQALTDRYFDHVFLTAPLKTYEAAETRPAVNPAYQAHCHLLMTGLLYNMTGSLEFSILRTGDLSERLDYVSDLICGRLDIIETERRTARHIH